MRETKEIDILKKKGGRGVYICPSCIPTKKFRKLMKKEKGEIKQALLKQIISLIQIGWRGRLIKIGYEDTQKELQKDRKGFLIIAEDIAERTKRNILRERNTEFYQLFTKEQLGKFIGKKEVGIIFVPLNKFGLKLKGLIAQYFELERR